MNDETLDDAGLTRNQFLIWLGQETHPDSAQFNELTTVLIDQELDRGTFQRAVQAVLDGTDALRTVLRRIEGLPKAVVLDRIEYAAPYLDLSQEVDPDGALERWARHHVDVPTDLSERSFEFTLVKLAEARYAFGYRQHHLFSDATSMTIVFNRISECYLALAAGELDASPSYPPYTEYLEAERSHRQSDRYQRHAAYWTAMTDDPPDPLTFFEGRSLSPTHGLATTRIDLKLGVDRSETLRRFASRKGIHFISDDMSLFSVFMAAYLVVLHRLSGQETIALGVPWQNRRRPFRDTVGLFMEQNPFVVSVDAADTFESLIGKIRKEAMGSMRHLPYPAGNPGGRTYDATFNYTKIAVGDRSGLLDRPRWYRPSEGLQSLGFQVYDFGGTGDLTLSFEFNAELFDPAHRDTIVDRLLHCLEACVDDAAQPIGEISMLTDGDRARLLTEWNATAADHPGDLTVVGLFETQVARRPAAIAARCDDRSMTYEQLDRRATMLAGRLAAAGVAPGVEVGICLDRSLDMLVAILGVLKAGGAYVPLDPAFPIDRLQFMLEDSGTSLVLTQSDLLGDLDTGQIEVICLDRIVETDPATGPALGPDRVGPDHLAYVLYTSGSTGRPKGVEVPHRALANLLLAMRSEPGLGEEDTLLALTTLSFDIAGLELFLPLIVGGVVDIATSRQAADGRLLLSRLERGDVTTVQATPATWRMLLDAGWEGTPGLKALVGGEPLPPDLAAALVARTKSLWNMYGPTETTIWSSVKQITDGGAEITIGTPIGNTRFHVLDPQLQPVPIGITGELLIGGAGLARGYRNRHDLTAERFIPDPFSDDPAARLYRTGDLVRYRQDGELVHLGRLDNQVKVRGFRIELGEIESALITHPAVRQAAVAANTDRSGRTRLVAYCLVDGEDLPTPTVLRNHLRRTLPDYMVPHRFVDLDEFPLTPNGKLDRKSLPEPAAPAPAPSASVAPTSPTERTVADLFATVLGVPPVGVDDDFFDLGGDSILALQLIMGLEDALETKLPLHMLNDTSTVAGLSRIIDGATVDPSGARDGRSSDRRGSDSDNATRQRLVEIWTRVLDIEHVSTDESFLDLQSSPDLLPRMLAEVRDEFGVIAEGISIIDFKTDPTIDGLATVLDDSFSATSSLVVPLQPKGSKKPLFLIHGGGGYVFFYRALAARLGPDQPVYGVRARTRADKGGRSFDQSTRVEQLAAAYIAEIRTIQKKGPYLLGGASFGGVIAFEMAKQLAASGEQIESPVFLFDAFVTKPEGWTPEGQDYSLGTATLDARQAHFEPPEEKPRAVAGRGPAGPVADGIRSLWGFARLVFYSALWRITNLEIVWQANWARERFRMRHETFEVIQLKTLEHYLEVTFRLLMRYRPAPYPGSAVLFRTESGYDPEPGWRSMIRGGLDVHTMPGSHLEMMEEPGVATTVSLLRQHLDPAPAPERAIQAPSAVPSAD